MKRIFKRLKQVFCIHDRSLGMYTNKDRERTIHVFCHKCKYLADTGF